MKTNMINTNSIMRTYIKYLCAVLLLLGTSAYAWGSAVTFHYTTDKGATALSLTKNGVTISSGGADLQASNGYYRINASSNMNIAHSTNNIRRVVVHCVNPSYASHLKHKSGTAGTVTYKGDEVYWEGSAKTVYFLADVGEQVRFNAVRVVLDDGSCSLLVWNNSLGMYEIFSTVSSSTSLPYSGLPTKGDYTFMSAWSKIEFQSDVYPSNSTGIYSQLLWSSNSPTAGSNLELYAAYSNSDYTTRPGSDYTTWITITITATPSSYGSAATSTGETIISVKEGQVITLEATPNSGYAFDYWSYSGADNTYLFDDESAAETDFYIDDAHGSTTGTITAHFVEVTCNNPTVAFANAGPYARDINGSGFTNLASATYSASSTGQTITYSSNNSGVASVDENTGAVTIGSTAGTARITATAEGTAEYCEMTASYLINVSAIAPTLSHNTSGKELTTSSITSGGVTVAGGIITNKGGANITEYGFVIGTSSGVTVADAVKQDKWTGDKTLNTAFSSKTFTGLTPYTDYYVRAYAYNGTAYGYSTAITFKTLQRYTITYDANGGTGTIADQYKDHGVAVTLSDGSGFSRTGYTLTKWNTATGGGGDNHSLSESYTTNANLDLYAIWTANTYSVRFNRNGGTGGADMANQDFTYGVAQNLTTNTYTRTGYTFAGWALSENGIVAHADGANVSNLSSTNGDVVDLYAKWTANTIELELSANGGENDGSATVKYDATALATINHATYDGYNLVGYYAEDTHTTKVLNNDGSFAATDVTGYITDGKWSRTTTPTTLFAYWLAEIRTVTFDLQGKGVNFTRDVENGTPVARPTPDPTNIDYNFEGWYDEAACRDGHEYAEKFLGGASAANITTNTIIYAKWTAKEYENLIFACVDLGLVTEDGDPALITSRNGINVMATKKLKVTVSGALSGHAVKLEGSDTDLKFYKNDGTRFIELTNADADHTLVAPLDQQEVYVSYAPSDAGTTGAITSPSITVKCDGFEETFSGKVKVRNLPNAVAIVAKVGNTYQALPANIASASNPAPVMVSLTVADGVNKASGPSTVSYKLWSAAVVNSANDRWGTATAAAPSALYGDRLRFSCNNNSDKALWANNSATKNTISDGTGAIDEVGDYFDNDPGYEWIVTTTEVGGEFVYTLQTDQTNNTNNLRLWGSKWGTYGSSNGQAEVYIMPLIETATADVTVMEWGTDQIAVKYANAGTVASGTFKARIGTADQTTVTCTSLGGDIYKLTGVGALQSNPAKTLTLNMTESTPKQAVFAIPLIVTASKTEAEISALVGADLTEGRKVAKGLDVIIRSGGTLTTGTAQGKFANLYIYPGGKAEITNNIGFGNIYLRGGFSWLDAEKDYRLPQMKVDDDITIDGVQQDGNGVYYDLYLDKRRYYMMAVPKDVNLESMTNEEGGDDATIWLKQYSGKGRTQTPKTSGWVNISGNKLLRGVGYEMSIKPRNAGAMNGRTIGILRMPLLQSTAWTNEGECMPAVKAWGYNDDNVRANNKGWNFIGNPYFTAFQVSAADGTVMEVRDMVHHEENGQWTGTWDWTESEAVKYVTIPQKMYDDYTDIRALNYKLESFYPFFIQAKLDGNLTFTGSPVLKAPSILRNKLKEREVMIDFILTDANGIMDEAGLTIGNEYSADFDMEDKEKTIVSENYLKVYTMVGEYRAAFNSLPEAVAELPIPVGYIAPIAGTYDFSLVEGNYSSVKHVWLTDYETSRTVDLLDGAYEFETANGTNQTRFALNVILKPEAPETPTGTEEIESTDDGPTKFIYHDKMYIKQNGVIYDATGKKVREINK